MSLHAHRSIKRQRAGAFPARRRFMAAATVAVLAMHGVLPAVAHEGEQHGQPAPGATISGGPVRLTEEAKKNLGLEVEEAQFRSIERIVRCFGIVEAVPDKVNLISIRTSGRAIRVLVNQGDEIEQGQLLAEVEARQIGNPPPTLSVRSTMSGIVTQRNVFVGESIEPETPLFQIADLSQVRVKCRVFEADAGQVRLRQPVRMNFQAYPDRHFEGKVGFLGGEIENDTRSLPVWIDLPNVDLALRPNMRGDGHVVVGVAEDALSVPTAAVLGDAGNYFVYIDTGKTYERKSVVLGARDDRYIEIADGLVPGDRVVTQGNYQLQFAVSLEPAPPVKPATATPEKVAP